MEREHTCNEQDIRSALKRKYARKTGFPKDFGEKVMKRMEAERKTLLRRRVIHIGISSAAALFVLLWICVPKKKQSEMPQPIVIARQVAEEHQVSYIKQDTTAVTAAVIVPEEETRKVNREKKVVSQPVKPVLPRHIAERKTEKEQEPVHVQDVGEVDMEEVIAARFELAMTANQELRNELQLSY